MSTVALPDSLETASGTRSSARADLAALAACACARLDARLQACFSAFHNALFDAACGGNDAGQRQQQMNLLRVLTRCQPEIAEGFREEIAAGIETPGCAVSQPPQAGFAGETGAARRREYLRVAEEMSARAAGSCAAERERLARSLAPLYDLPPRDPLGARRLLDVFMERSGVLPLDIAQQRLLLRAFERHVLADLGGLYRDVAAFAEGEIAATRQPEPRAAPATPREPAPPQPAKLAPEAREDYPLDDEEPEVKAAQLERLITRLKSVGLRLPLLRNDSGPPAEVHGPAAAPTPDAPPVPDSRARAALAFFHHRRMAYAGGAVVALLGLLAVLWGLPDAPVPASVPQVPPLTSSAPAIGASAQPSEAPAPEPVAAPAPLPASVNEAPAVSVPAAASAPAELEPDTAPAASAEPRPPADDTSAAPAVPEPAPAPAADADAEDAAATDERIEYLLERAQQAGREFRLTVPFEDSAAANYMAVLAIDDFNLRALHGLERIVEQYVAMARLALAEGNLRRAELYLNRAWSVMPGSNVLVALQQEIAAVRDGAAPATAVTVSP